ncbi:hypothetical protein SAMN05192553_101436 [Cyclobacterium xiamenense]|uniref:Uncharacterized protein n=1 Tax=Cyclobacterium xiamenense TaxID=1297121 RepID=A0A1H6U229_9BACT|nr:hypothetical protein [Cyclobacterium xiamenense]SEI82470.1 hypothetical protein SAMN05192553_101436 [Cyclobacterium xiamenense]
MDLVIGFLFVLAVALALYLIFKRIFSRKKGQVDRTQELSSKEVIGKEVSNFDADTQKGDTTDESSKNP